MTLPFPSGAIGVWYADQAVTTGGNPVIPNSVSATPVSKNLLRAPRRAFNSIWYVNSGVVSVDSNVVGPDSLTQASTLTCTGGWELQYRSPGTGATLTWPAGTYTLAINAQRATGSDQSFKFLAPDGTQSTTKVATASWQRFTYTFTAGSPVSARTALVSFDGATGATIAVCDFEMFQGSSDLGPEVLDGHMYLGGAAVDNVPTIGGGYADFTAASGKALAFFQFLNPQSVTNFTLSVLVNRTAIGNLIQRAILQELGGINFQLMDAFSLPTKDVAAVNFSGVTLQGQIGMWNQTTAVGPHVITVRYDGTNIHLFFDDVLVVILNSPGLSAVTLANMFVEYNDQGGGANGGDKIAAMALWSSALTNAQVYQILDAWAEHFLPFFSYTMWPYYYFADGDSIPTGGVGGVIGYPFIYGPTASQPVFGNNYAVGGQTLAGMVAQTLPTELTLLPPVSRQSGRFFVLSVGIGTNDLATTTGAAEAESLASNYVDPLQGVGFKVLTGTVVDRTGAGDGPTWTTNSLAFNQIITNAWGHGRHGSGIVDFAANVHLGPPGSGAANDTTYFNVDGIHPNQAGENLMATILKLVADAAFLAPTQPRAGYIDQRDYMRRIARKLNEEEDHKAALAERRREQERKAAEDAATEAQAQTAAQAERNRQLNETISRINKYREQEARDARMRQSLQSGAHGAGLSAAQLHHANLQHGALEQLVREHKAMREVQTAADAAERERIEAANEPQDPYERLLYHYRKRVKKILGT